MSRPSLEVADIFRDHGPAWRRANAGHVSLGQLKVMSAIKSCRTAALGGHVARCEECAHSQISYNSCRNRHCPKCQGAAAKEWLAAREADLLPVPYYHVVFTLPAAIADIAYQNKTVIYDLLFKASAETLITIAADPKHLGARVGITSVLHSWGSALTHHPHVHMIVPGGGISLDGERWVACHPGFFLPVRVLSRLFRRLFLQMLLAAHQANRGGGGGGGFYKGWHEWGENGGLRGEREWGNRGGDMFGWRCIKGISMGVGDVFFGGCGAGSGIGGAVEEVLGLWGVGGGGNRGGGGGALFCGRGFLSPPFPPRSWGGAVSRGWALFLVFG